MAVFFPPCKAYVESATHDCTTMTNFTNELVSVNYKSLDCIDVETCIYIHVTIAIQRGHGTKHVTLFGPI